MDRMALKNVVDGICRDLVEQRNSLPDSICVNWADFSCVDVREGLDLCGSSFVEIILSEAPVENAMLCAMIATKLKGLGYPGVEVRCEW